LPLVGAQYEKARIVRDGNLITAGGVTAGVDFGLAVVAEIAGEAVDRSIQLGHRIRSGAAIRFRPSGPRLGGGEIRPFRPLRQSAIGAAR
jgi:transcriptional regulator GlxA family with amidase domain